MIKVLILDTVGVMKVKVLSLMSWWLKTKMEVLRRVRRKARWVEMSGEGVRQGGGGMWSWGCGLLVTSSVDKCHTHI